jgi:hypothetical protein
MSTHDRINSALQTLRDGCIFILDFLITILDPADASYMTCCDCLYVPSVKEKNLGTGRLEKALDFLWEDSRSQARVLEWMRPHAISYICNTVYRKMDMLIVSGRSSIGMMRQRVFPQPVLLEGSHSMDDGGCVH